MTKMPKKKIITRILAAALALCCVFSSFLYSLPASADEELDDLQQQYDDLEEELRKNKQELGELEGEISDQEKKLKTLNSDIDAINTQIEILQSQMNNLNSQISSKEARIEELNAEINDLNEKIESTNAQIDKVNEEMSSSRELLMSRIRENYVTGDTTNLEILFSSDDISSYFARKELMSKVSEEDAELLQTFEEEVSTLNSYQNELKNNKAQLQNDITELEAEKAELAEDKAALVEKQDIQKSKKAEVSEKQQEVQSVINGLDEDSDEYKAEIKRQEAEMEELSAQIDAYVAEHGSSVGDTPDASYENDGNMAWPVKFESYITAGYPAYSNGSAHWGIDICAVGGNTRGRPFNAAQGGEVIIAVNDGNYNYGFGNYCVIDHGDGTQTLYAHSDNIQVSVGQVVKKGQQIGIIGATGNVTGPHLHFEVRVKNADGTVSRVNPLNYVSNPYD